jgi:hypothetical protein
MALPPSDACAVARWGHYAGADWRRRDWKISNAVKTASALVIPDAQLRIWGARSASPESIERQVALMNGFRACAKWRIPE